MKRLKEPTSICYPISSPLTQFKILSNIPKLPMELEYGVQGYNMYLKYVLLQHSSTMLKYNGLYL